LGNKKVPYGHQKKMPGVGITGRTTLLVYQWDDMPGKSAKRLVREDEDMPKMQGF
jgi:hypothetical protein